MRKFITELSALTHAISVRLLLSYNGPGRGRLRHTETFIVSSYLVYLIRVFLCDDGNPVLQCVIVVFSDYTRLPFTEKCYTISQSKDTLWL